MLAPWHAGALQNTVLHSHAYVARLHACPTFASPCAELHAALLARVERRWHPAPARLAAQRPDLPSTSAPAPASAGAVSAMWPTCPSLTYSSPPSQSRSACGECALGCGLWAVRGGAEPPALLLMCVEAESCLFGTFWPCVTRQSASRSTDPRKPLPGSACCPARCPKPNPPRLPSPPAHARSYSALLRLPERTKPLDLQFRIERVLEELGLEHVAGSQVGGCAGGFRAEIPKFDLKFCKAECWRSWASCT